MLIEVMRAALRGRTGAGAVIQPMQSAPFQAQVGLAFDLGRLQRRERWGGEAALAPHKHLFLGGLRPQTPTKHHVATALAFDLFTLTNMTRGVIITVSLLIS